MHHIYTTDAFILKSLPTGEANRYYFLYCQDLGFVKATAQGVRLDKSKLKGHLQDFCLVKISLVKGKEIWRIINVDTIEKGDLLKDINKLIAVKNIFSLLLRLLHGEEKNEALFYSIYQFYIFLIKNNLSQDNIKNLETITILRILYHLGYFKESSPTRLVGAPTENVEVDLFEYVKNDDLSINILNLFESKKKIAILDINSALEETHL